jgi:hypothetical protein
MKPITITLTPEQYRDMEHAIMCMRDGAMTPDARITYVDLLNDLTRQKREARDAD